MTTERDMIVIKDVFRSGFELNDLAWKPWREPGREGVESFVLWAPSEDGAEDSAGLLLRFAPGAHGDMHRHLGYELMLVLDGVLRNDDGDEYSAGTLVVENADSIHQMSSETGCTVLAIRTRPARPLAAEQQELSTPAST